jgi:hypothetical protein
VDVDAHPRLTLGRGGSEREIYEGDFPLRKNRGGRWATLVVALRGKGEGGSKLGGAWCRGERGGSLYSCGKAVRAARPAGFATGSRRDVTAVLLDKTRRAAMQWRASRGRRRGRDLVGHARLGAVSSSVR